MRLYYTPGTCSLAAHIVLREADYEFTLEQMDLKTKKTEFSKDFNAINDKSSVPFLLLDDDLTISEVPVIIQYLTDNKPASAVAPKRRTVKRVRLDEWLNFIAKEVPKSFHPFFAGMGDDAKNAYLKKLRRHLNSLTKVALQS